MTRTANLLPLIAIMYCTDVGAEQNYFSGTSIAAIMTTQGIYVAADSKMVRLGSTNSDAGSTSKIVQVDNLFFANARLLKDTQGRFSVHEIGRASCRERVCLAV